MNDGMLAWKPLDGRPTRTVVEGLPTVLLALRGPMGPVDAAVVGTATGFIVLGSGRIVTTPGTTGATMDTAGLAATVISPD